MEKRKNENLREKEWDRKEKKNEIEKNENGKEKENETESRKISRWVPNWNIKIKEVCRKIISCR